MIIEELIKFDNSELSFKKLIYNEYEPYQKIVGILTITTGMVILWFSFIICNYHLFWTIPGNKAN